MSKVDTIETLEAIYNGTPSEASMIKVASQLTPLYRKWIMASRFCVLTTVGEAGTDGSPRGDIGPVVTELDPQTLAMPDWRGYASLIDYMLRLRVFGPENAGRQPGEGAEDRAGPTTKGARVATEKKKGAKGANGVTRVSQGCAKVAPRVREGSAKGLPRVCHGTTACQETKQRTTKKQRVCQGSAKDLQPKTSAT